jgi:hypothetical protein
MLAYARENYFTDRDSRNIAVSIEINFLGVNYAILKFQTKWTPIWRHLLLILKTGD